MNEEFGDRAGLAERLLAVHGPSGNDGSHDLSHLFRVWRNARAIAATEPECDLDVLVAAVVLHDCVAVEKNAPERSQASRLAAARATDILRELGWDPARIARVAHAIEAHSFSAGILPETIEARILQDADRLDAIGAVGVARCFYVAGRMGSSLYSCNDPAGRGRPLNDQQFALDHFGAKLFRLRENFQTAEGQRRAAERTDRMRQFFQAFLDEVGEGGQV